MILGHPVRLGVALAAFLLLALIPAGFDVGLKFDAALSVVWGFGILSIVLLTGYVGQVSLCQATFAGVGAYAAGMMFNTFHVGYVVGIVVGVLAAFALGVLVGLPALRLRGITLAIVTLAIALVFDKYVFQDHIFDWFTGGSGGWRVDGADLLGLRADSSSHLLAGYEVLLALFVLIALLIVNLHQSGAGRRFRAIRDSELAASTMGVNLTRYKLLAFGLSAGIAGLGGSFYPLIAGSVSLTRYGHGTFMGRYSYDISYDWFSLALGVLLIAQLILLPDGVWGDLHAHAAKAIAAVRVRTQRRVRVA
jgi:ABC-type branched-subunit amino acid transport system permease subunit